MHNSPHVFMRKKYTIHSSIRIVALRSVNKIFTEGYDFAACYDTISPFFAYGHIYKNCDSLETPSDPLV
jgi:hypothetical protein